MHPTMSTPTNETTGADHQHAHTASAAGPPLTLTELTTLPAVVDLMTAARALAIGRTKAYEMARNGEFPCHIIKIGETYRVPTAKLLRLLGTVENASHDGERD